MFTRPTLAALIAQAKADIASHLSGSDPLLRWSVEGVLARAMAGLAHGNHGHLVWLSKQLIPDTADPEWVTRWASIRGLTPTPAVKAQLEVDITGNDATYDITSSVWTTNDGTTYVPNSTSVTITAGVATVDVTAEIASVDGNQANGVVLSLVSPISGIDSDGAVSSTLVYGFDQEAPAALLARLLLNLRNPPKGGGPGDYVNWMLEVPGVTRAWEFPLANGVGTVAGYFVCDALTPIIPTAGIVATVQAHIDTKAPVTVAAGNIVVYAPTGSAFNLTIDLTPAGGGGVDTAAIRAAVILELEDLLTRKSVPGCTIYLQEIEAAIQEGSGNDNFDLVSPATDTTYGTVEMPIMGIVTWA